MHCNDKHCFSGVERQESVMGGSAEGASKVLVMFDFTGQIVATQLLIILLFKLLSMAEISHFFLVKIKD